MFLQAFIFVILGVASSESVGYGPEPWLSGDPKASPGSVIVSALGTARFTILSDALIRMEWTSGGGNWEDSRTLVVWNRARPVVNFSVTVNHSTTTISTRSLVLVHTDDGQALSASNLYVQLLEPAFSSNSTRVWTPDMTVASDPGQASTQPTRSKQVTRDLTCSQFVFLFNV